MTKAENNILLFSITLCWAASYIFIKNLPADLSGYAYLTLTTGIAAVLMAVIFWKKLRSIKRSTMAKGFFLSLLLSLNLLAERKGIGLMEPETASFLSALAIIMVPLLLFFLKRRPGANSIAGAGIILFGLCAGMNFKLSGFESMGTLFMLGGCACSAVYTIAVDRYAKEEEPVLICIVQMFFSALTGFILWFSEEPSTFFAVNYTRELLSNIFILAFFTKAYAYIVLMFSQKYTDAVSVTVIGSTEPVVTLALAVILPAAYGGERRLTAYGLAGAVIIAVGAVVADMHFLERKHAAAQNAAAENAAEALPAAKHEPVALPETIEKPKAYTIKQFFVILAAFLILGISFKVMVLVEGLTEVRPVNAIPPVAGLLCGPVGALACGLGNLAADLVGTFSKASVLGFAANMLAAFLPYRIWHLFSAEGPNLKNGRNRLFYILISLGAAMTAAWILSFGLYWMEGIWMKEIYTFVFWNNFGFSVGLGMPILIILTSPDIGMTGAKAPGSIWPAKCLRVRRIAFGGYLCLMGSLLLGVLIMGLSPEQAYWMRPVSAASLAVLLGLIV